jgi:hypothetical protein
MCPAIGDYLVSFFIGAAASAVVAFLFYRLGRADSEKEAAIVQINEVLLRINQLAPDRKESSQRSKDGVDDTSHWMKCVSEVAAENGHTVLAHDIEAISQEMVEKQQSGYRDSAEMEAKKNEWRAKLRALRRNPAAASPLGVKTQKPNKSPEAPPGSRPPLPPSPSSGAPQL